MRVPTFSGNSSRLAKPHKLSAAGLAAVGAASMVLGLAAPGQAEAEASSQALPAAYSAEVTGGQNKQTTDGLYAQQEAPAKTTEAFAPREKTAPVADEKAAPKTAKTEVQAKAKAEAQTKAESKAKAEAKSKAEDKAASERSGEKTADRSAERKSASESKKPSYPNNVDGWIREALVIMEKNDIPGSYEGIHRNIMRESGGDPKAINNWDINAQNGIPSKGLLQVIPPTFDAYHVEGTEKDLYDPVANIVAACNYAADRYGSMDNVDSAY